MPNDLYEALTDREPIRAHFKKREDKLVEKEKKTKKKQEGGMFDFIFRRGKARDLEIEKVRKEIEGE